MLFFPVFLFMMIRIYGLSGMQYKIFLENFKETWYKLSDERGSSKTTLSLEYLNRPESINGERPWLREILLSKTESAVVPEKLTTTRHNPGWYG
jgi:hypothetical protein